MNITLTITTTPELTEALHAIATALTGENKKSSPVAQKEKLVNTAAAQKADDVETLEVETQSEKITIESIRELVSTIASKGKKAELKKLLAEFDAQNVSALDAKNYSAFYQKLKEL